MTDGVAHPMTRAEILDALPDLTEAELDANPQLVKSMSVQPPRGTGRVRVLKIDGEVGNKKQYDPRSWGKEAEAGMAARVVEACEALRSAGTHQK